MYQEYTSREFAPLDSIQSCFAFDAKLEMAIRRRKPKKGSPALHPVTPPAKRRKAMKRNLEVSTEVSIPSESLAPQIPLANLCF